MLLSLAGILLSFCGDYAKRLPNGYSLVRVNAAEVLIVGPEPRKSITVFPTVDRYAVLGDLVVGHVSIPGLPEPTTGYTKPGYFILDVARHEVELGLDEEIWRDRLRGRGIASAPRLKRPSRFDREFSS